MLRENVPDLKDDDAFWNKLCDQFLSRSTISFTARPCGLCSSALCRVYWGPPCFQGNFTHNEKEFPALGASLVYNFLLVVTIPPKYVSGCWARVMMSCTRGKDTLLKESPCFYKTEKNTSSVVLPLAWPHRTLYMCILTSDRRTKQGIHCHCWHLLVKVMLEMLS